MRTMTAEEYDRSVAGGCVLAREGSVPRVVRLADGSFLKVFRRKGPLSSTIIRSYATRFARAAVALARREIPTVRVTEVMRVAPLRREAVHYQPLAGTTLREHCEADTFDGDLLDRFAAFVASLHDRGVYFRGLHFGNVLERADGSFGLIDISDTRFRRRPLTGNWRARNFRPMLRYPEARAALERFGAGRFIAAYVRGAGMDERCRRRFVECLPEVDELFRGLPIDGGAVRASVGNEEQR